MNEITTYDKGVCPFCASTDFTWGDSEIDGEFVYYNITCNKCGGTGYETYKLSYHSTTITK
jgi:hypothetical protein